MDDLGKMLGSLGGDTGAGAQPQLAGALGGLIDGQGGLEGLLGQLSSAGLGDQVASWVSTGPNQPVDPQQLAGALGPDTVNQLSAKTGLSVSSLLPMLAAFLPQIINALTPDGKVPAGGAGGGIDIGSILSGLGGAAAGGSSAGSSSQAGSVPDIGKILGGG
ncbi:MAG TPA: YidB family protein [Candidatus Limnocylindrales bacterium]|nr:YidB family protein [Candidatus Limnocylindrales bacterium]